ncbi:integrase [Agrobacterium pusense]|uniref:Integrase n=1 Tax=Agrobacterium pusense TaxID=648995 RepID=A0AA44EGJ5_9HYPH|nr:integrase [Agrobacterium pusense]NRF07006.1 integrase [Agrobacterium pusense]NRF07584.1 integrase [Agrobacterium pusense]NRF17622.1 integrase [Agrobacterium pusense]NRF17870.1 integrase [Agrobacterium pusense]NRF18316.1 integrase [Agrobacterium pusense]
MVAQPVNAEQRIRNQEIRISTISMWSDRIWQLDVDVPGTTPADLVIDWGIAFVDGSRFTDEGWSAWREAARRFLWSLRVTPPPGRRRARGATLVRRFQTLRILIRWMVAEGYRCFADLDRDAAHRFLGVVYQRPGRGGRLLSETVTPVGYIRILDLLYLQRDWLPDAPAEPLVDPITGSRSLRPGQLSKSMPYTPDAIAVPLISAALRLIGTPANDIIALREQAEDAHGQALSSGFGYKARQSHMRACLDSFRFATVPGEVPPWRTEPVLTMKLVQFLVTRIYDACFVVIAYLVGARASEILGLRAGCIERHAAADGTETFAYLSGRIYKTAVGTDGTPHRWVAPDPVVRAVTVLERLSAPIRQRMGREELWLSAMAGRGGMAIPRSSGLAGRLNGPFASFINLPLYNGRSWHLTTHQGRKTFARFVGRRDRTGLDALASHFGHVTRAMTDKGYVGTDFDLTDLIDAETSNDTRTALEDLLTTATAAGSAGRVISAHSRFRGRTRDGDAADYVDFILRETDMRLGHCDWGYCVYRRESASCLGDDRGPNPVIRTQSICATCSNFAVTQKHRPVWEERRKQNARLLAHPMLDDDSRALAKVRIDECDRILGELQQGRENDDE